MPYACVLFHITDALSLAAGSGACLSLSAESCACVTWGLSHVFSADLKAHTLGCFHTSCNPQFSGITGDHQWAWMWPSERDIRVGCVCNRDYVYACACVRVCVMESRCYFYPLSSCSCVSVARSSVLGWFPPETRVKQTLTSLLLWMVV